MGLEIGGASTRRKEAKRKLSQSYSRLRGNRCSQKPAGPARRCGSRK